MENDPHEGREYTGYSEWDLKGKRRLRIGDDCVRAYLSSGEEQYQKAAARIKELEHEASRTKEDRAKLAAELTRAGQRIEELERREGVRERQAERALVPSDEQVLDFARDALEAARGELVGLRSESCDEIPAARMFLRAVDASYRAEGKARRDLQWENPNKKIGYWSLDHFHIAATAFYCALTGLRESERVHPYMAASLPLIGLGQAIHLVETGSQVEVQIDSLGDTVYSANVARPIVEMIDKHSARLARLQTTTGDQ